jgi:hypothetical protein
VNRTAAEAGAIDEKVIDARFLHRLFDQARRRFISTPLKRGYSCSTIAIRRASSLRSACSWKFP